MKKIIIIGDTCGNFDYVFDRIHTIHTKHGPFTAAFCIGNFFGKDSSQLTPYIKQEKTIALPTYFIVSNDADTSLIDTLPNGGSICTNLTFLGRFGVLDIHGLSVAYLSGLYDSNLFSKTPSEIRTYLAVKELKEDTTSTPPQDTDKALQNTKSATQFRRYYCSKDVNTSIHNAHQVDLLLTAEWPRCFHLGMLHGIDQSSIIPKHLSLSQLSQLGRSPIVNKLAMQFCPQYHFSGNEDVFFRLTPYKSDENTKYLTRFIGLGQTHSNTEQRSVYAVNVSPLSADTPPVISASTKYTKCPYTLPFKRPKDQRKNTHNGKRSDEEKETLKRVVHKRKFSEMMSENEDKQGRNHRWTDPHLGHRKPSDNPPSNYVCYICGIPGHYINECPQNRNKNNKVSTYHPGGNRDDYFFEKFGGRRAMKRARKSGGECWFCLGSTKVESHMVVSIAEYTYVALAKGPLTKNHLLIIPINHLSNSMKFPVGVRKEIDRYLLCLEKCYEQENKVLLICDRNLPTQYTQHCYLEIVAIDKDKMDGLEQVLFKEAEKADIKFVIHDTKKADKAAYNVGSFGYLILHNNGNGKKYVHSVQSGMKKRISLNFLRKVIAMHLDVPEKAEWTACIQQTGDETNQTNRLKDKFKAYDWTHSHLLK